MDPAPLHEAVADAPPGGAAYWLRTEDSVQIRAGFWPDGPRGTVLIFPGRTEFIEKYGRAAGALGALGFATATVDWRGQGMADRLIDDPGPGHVHRFRDYQRDVRALVRAAEAAGLPKPWYLLAHSMGGCIGLRALREGLAVDRAAFTGPMWGIEIAPPMRPVAWAVSGLSRPLGLSDRLVPGTEARNYVFSSAFEGNTLTSDREMWDYMRAQMAAHPDMVIGGPTLHWLNEALREVAIMSRLPAPAVPALTWIGSEEKIVSIPAVRRRMASWPGGRLETLAGGQHEVLMETPAIRRRIFAALDAFFGTGG